MEVTAFGQGHGRIRSLGYRFGPVAYSSDADVLDEAAFAALSGVECWIVDALRLTPHPSHAHVARTLEWIARVKPKRAILTNMHVDLDYDALQRNLPKGVEPAWDGMDLVFTNFEQSRQDFLDIRNSRDIRFQWGPIQAMFRSSPFHSRNGGIG